MTKAVTQRAQSPLSDLNYDLLTILQNKLQALAAYAKYQQDCQRVGASDCEALIATMRRDDERHVERLRDELERIVKAGEFH